MKMEFIKGINTVKPIVTFTEFITGINTVTIW